MSATQENVMLAMLADLEKMANALARVTPDLKMAKEDTSAISLDMADMARHIEDNVQVTEGRLEG
eukprot:3238737-Lingulodinium_polyedra.AAC.1